jgi:DNA modification methylase
MNRVVFGDCRDTMRTLIADGVRVQMCVTSPLYFGSGTTGQVALQHGRQYLGCELNEEYKPLQDKRIGL